MHIKIIDQSSTVANGSLPVEATTMPTPTVPHLSANDGGIMTMQANNSSGDPFDGSAEPIVYLSDNRMSVMMEFSSTIIYIIFAALLLALLSILPGVRRTKMTSFLGLLTIILVGASILLSIDGSTWLTGQLQLYEVPYGALTSETITGKLEVNIGLSSTNVTLFGQLVGVANRAIDDEVDDKQEATVASKLVDYNERFHWDEPDNMASEHVGALRRGLPYPILTISEYLSQDSAGFNWMRQLRQAGYFTSLALYTSLASWCLTVVVMCALPVYLPHMMQITGALMMSSVWIYTLLIQSPKSFVIQFGEHPMEFSFGYTYVVTFMTGAMSMFSGVLMFIMQMNKPHEQLTIMDCENFTKNQRAFFGHSGTNDQDQEKPGFEKMSHKVNSVVIPIADIEDKFAAKPVQR